MAAANYFEIEPTQPTGEDIFTLENCARLTPRSAGETKQNRLSLIWIAGYRGIQSLMDRQAHQARNDQADSSRQRTPWEGLCCKQTAIQRL